MNQWTPAVLHHVQNLHGKLDSLNTSHAQECLKHSKLHAACLNTSLLLTSLSGLVLTIGDALPSTSAQTITVTAAALAYCAGIVTTVIKYGNFGAKAREHHTAATEYHKLYSLVSVQLSLPPEQREAPISLLGTVTRGMHELYETSPLLEPGKFSVHPAPDLVTALVNQRRARRDARDQCTPPEVSPRAHAVSRTPEF